MVDGLNCCRLSLVVVIYPNIFIFAFMFKSLYVIVTAEAEMKLEI